MTARTTDELGRGIGGGALAGLVGAVVLLAATIGTALLGGADPWLVVKSGAAPFMGARAGAPGFDAFPVVVGLFARFAAGVVWGALFGALAIGAKRRIVLGLGVGWGVLAWLVTHYAVLPSVGAPEIAARWPVPFSFAQYVLFGLGIGSAFLPFARRTAKPRAPSRWKRRAAGPVAARA